MVLTALIVLLLAFIWGNSLLPGEKSDALSRWILEHVLGLDSGGADFDEGNHMLRKAAHMTEFMLLAALIALRQRRRRRCWLYGLIAVPAAAADETIQRFSNRGSRLSDVGIDCLGVLLGLLLVFLILRNKNKKEGG